MKNKWVSFLSKLAFICNLCFLVGVIIRHTQDFIGNQPVKATVIILGIFISPLLNIILQISLLALRAGKKQIPVKAWLRIVNAIIFAFQVIYYTLPGN